MSHPTVRLIDYVDGALAPEERAEVDAHLRGCATSRAEVRLAEAGREAAARLTTPVAPAGLAEAALAEAAGLAASRAPEVRSLTRSSRRAGAPRWAAVVGAAAVIALVVLVAPKLGHGPSSDTASMAAGAGATVAYPSASAVEIQHANYSLNDLPGQAAQLRASFATSSSFDGAAEAQPSASGVSAPALQGETARISVSRLRDATACLDRAFGNPDGSLARVIAADFEGHSAYFGVYLSGPDAGLPPTLLQLDVAAVHGCRLLAQSTARL